MSGIKQFLESLMMSDALDEYFLDNQSSLESVYYIYHIVNESFMSKDGSTKFDSYGVYNFLKDTSFDIRNLVVLRETSECGIDFTNPIVIGSKLIEELEIK